MHLKYFPFFFNTAHDKSTQKQMNSASAKDTDTISCISLEESKCVGKSCNTFSRQWRVRVLFDRKGLDILETQCIFCVRFFII